MNKDIVILGAGVIGLSTAYYCSLRGHRVTVVDRSPEERDGCSFGNAGMIVPSHFIPLAAPGMVALGLKWMLNPESPFYIKPRLDWGLMDWGMKFWKAATPGHVTKSAPLLRDLSLASRACFEELATLTKNDFGLATRGLLMLCKTEKALEEEGAMAETARLLGVPAEVLGREQTAKMDPSVRMEVAGSVYFPKDCHLVPQKFMRTLKHLLDARGVQFVWDKSFESWGKVGSKVKNIKASNQEISGDEFVLCGGVWSSEIGAQLGLKLPMQAGKGYSLTMPQPPVLPELCSILVEARIAVTPMNSSLRVGGTMEMSGVNLDVNPSRIRGIVRAFPKYFPDFGEKDFAGIRPWRGLRPCSPDGLPYIGRTKKYDNVTVATGHAMMGLSLGPITGRLVSEILTDGKPSLDIGLLHPDRYA